MELSNLNATKRIIKDDKFGFELHITEDLINKDARFELITEVVQKTASAKLLKWTDDPFTVGFASYWTSNALQQYMRNKRFTATIVANKIQDRRLYGKIVDDLMKSGHYKLIRNHNVPGGIIWQLQLKEPQFTHLGAHNVRSHTDY